MKNKIFKWFMVIVGVVVIATSGVTLAKTIKDKINADKKPVTPPVASIELVVE